MHLDVGLLTFHFGQICIVFIVVCRSFIAAASCAPYDEAILSLSQNNPGRVAKLLTTCEYTLKWIQK